jgi:Lipocalin-like domain
MRRHDIFRFSAVAALGLALLPGSALAQQKPIKDQLVGTWTLLLVDNVKADGTHVPSYGPNPVGTAMFSPDGHYSLQIMRVGRPPFAANNLAAGTANENKAAISGIITHFGTYTVDQADKSFTIHIEGSSFPNWDGTRQKRLVTAITDDVATWTTPMPASATSGNEHAELVWKRAK